MFSLAAFDLQISTQPNFFSQKAAYEREASSWHCKQFLMLTSQGFLSKVTQPVNTVHVKV